jgi:predicted O-linked N-acetylglucosamine transferase (SPINDLY family)
MSQLQNQVLDTAVSESSEDLEILLQQDLYQLVQHYEQLIESEPENSIYYFRLGLFYLLDEQEELAHTTWLWTLAQSTEIEYPALIAQLTKLLDLAAKQFVKMSDSIMSQLIRTHLWEINPSDINNILQIIIGVSDSEIDLESVLNEYRLIELLQSQVSKVDSALLLQVLKQAISLKIESLIDLTNACLPYAQPKEVWVKTVLDGAYDLTLFLPEIAIDLSQICLKIQSDDIFTWFSYAYFHSNQPDCQRSIAAAKAFKERCLTPYWQLRSCYGLLRELAKAGDAGQAASLVPELKAALTDQFHEDIKLGDEDVRTFNSLIAIPGILQYFQDSPQENRRFQNHAALEFETVKMQTSVLQISRSSIAKRQERKRLKIGYIGHTLRTHSVGWLCRWLFQYHRHDEFHITSYCLNQPTDEAFTKKWFIDPSDASYKLPDDQKLVTEKIQEDEIDILVDIDSMTSPSTCAIMAMRSAPIQVTWLGFDACGLPAIDYFIADPWVLPDNAQDYYREKIWRLPQTYIAVEGFEVGTPNISRHSLNIPADAVVYYSSQAGSKRNPDNIRLQMQILKALPNSFLLVKGDGDTVVIHQMFCDLAREVGIDLEQIRFLGQAPSEFVHRANMCIADVVLDTYPYTGATTTLEALWMGVPVITKVGEQFAARNSYAFITNTGVKEGITHSDREYVELGIRLGQEKHLRHQISWQLHQSRKTSPLWDAKAFTEQMELAYRQMWKIYCQTEL